jgi:hypothetical protein
VFDPDIEVSSEQEVYRAYKFDNWSDSQRRPQRRCFIRRESEVGLSVGPSAEHAVGDLEFHHGCCFMLTSDVQAIEGITDDGNRLNLKVKPDTPAHANIIRVPLRSVHEKDALRIAGELMRAAKPSAIEPKPRVDPE